MVKVQLVSFLWLTSWPSKLRNETKSGNDASTVYVEKKTNCSRKSLAKRYLRSSLNWVLKLNSIFQKNFWHQHVGNWTCGCYTFVKKRKTNQVTGLNLKQFANSSNLIFDLKLEASPIRHQSDSQKKACAIVCDDMELVRRRLKRMLEY